MRHVPTARDPSALLPLPRLVARRRACVSAAPTPGLAARRAPARELRTCGNAVARQQLQCMQKTGAICAPGDAKIAARLAKLASKVLADCRTARRSRPLATRQR